MVYCSNTLVDNGTQPFIFKETVIISLAVIHGLHTSRILTQTGFPVWGTNVQSVLQFMYLNSYPFCCIQKWNTQCITWPTFCFRETETMLFISYFLPSCHDMCFLACGCTIVGILKQSSYLIAVAGHRNPLGLPYHLSGISGYAGRWWHENLEETMGEETKAARIKVTASQVATINIKILVFRLLLCYIYKNKKFWEELNVSLL